MTYEVHFTKTAQAKMTRLGLDPADIEDKVRDYLEDARSSASSDGDEFEIQDLMFSAMPADGKPVGEAVEIWLIAGNGIDGVVVDSGRMAQVAAPTVGEFAPGGRFHGKKVMMPIGDESVSPSTLLQ